jgi:hypothetical protein
MLGEMDTVESNEKRERERGKEKKKREVHSTPAAEDKVMHCTD